jgi:flagellar biosynthesis protein FliR
MAMHLSEAQIMQWLGLWLWPFLRVGGFVMAAPVIGTRMVPPRVRILLALALTAVLAPPLGTAGVPFPEIDGALLTAAHQVMIGATIGLILRLEFFVFEFAGQIIAQQMGLGFASLVDPQSGVQVPVLSHFYTLLATLIFFAIDAHLVLIQLLGESFQILPVGPSGITSSGLATVLDWSGGLIAAGLLLSLPIVIALLAINLAFGVMARSAPQLNILAVGFPITLFAGMLLVFITLGDLGEFAEALFENAFQTARLVIEAR